MWYLGVDLENSQAQKFEIDDNVKIDFKFANGQTVAAKVVNIIPDEERKNSVIILDVYKRQGNCLRSQHTRYLPFAGFIVSRVFLCIFLNIFPDGQVNPSLLA